MSLIKKYILFIALCTLCFHLPRVEGVTYVTDTGGYAYDQSRAATNLAAAVALGTVAVVGIIAIAVQNTHESSSSHSRSYSTPPPSRSYGYYSH